MYSVLLTDDAQKDFEELYTFILINDVPGKADYVLDQIEKAVNGLTEYPERGVFPKELLKLGIKEYREVFFKPYRVIYRIREDNVYVMLITDGRRDMQTLLSRRLLESWIQKWFFLGGYF